MSYERYAPEGRYSSQQQNPLVREAAYIAQQMDSGNAELAGQRLREDLYQLQRSPEQATQLINLVQQFDRKGNGADLEIRMGRQNGFSVANASIVNYDYYRDNRSGRVQRQQFSTDRICTILLPQEGRNRNYNGHYQSQSYYNQNGQFDQRTSFDPRGSSLDPASRFDRGSYYRSQMSSQFDPRDPSNWGPEEAWAANLRYRSGQAQSESYDWQNEQEGYTGYRPDWQQGYYNPEPSAHLPRQSYDYDQNQDSQRFQANNRSQHRHPRQSQGHQPGHGHNDSGRGNDSHGRGTTAGLEQEAAQALNRAQQMAARNGVKIDVTSGYRSYAEQSRLYAQLNGISPVARPGTSKHESGEAIDVKNYAQAKPYLLAAGFVHGDGRGKIEGDPWHFRYMG